MERVLSQADNGALILLHPKECTVEVLPELIDALRQEGFSFKKVTEIIS
jgi:peptidoglycan/xylan/chitin deacetylase (PgdA/CDA1 family)